MSPDTWDTNPSSLISAARNPIIRWEWVTEEWDQIREALLEHLELTMLAMLLGIVVSAVLAAIALRFRWTMTPITATTSLIYTLPSVALFALLAPVFGNLSRITAVLPLAAYTLLILVTNTVAGFQSVPQAVRDSADGMGLSPTRRVWSVELPLALPFIITWHTDRNRLNRGARDGRRDHRARWPRPAHLQRTSTSILDADDRRRVTVDSPCACPRCLDPWDRTRTDSLATP